MNSTEYDLFYKEMRRMADRNRRDGEEDKEIMRKLIERIGKVPDRTFTAEQICKVLNLALKEPIRRMGETTFWIHWESGVIDCAGRDLDKVKAVAEEQAKETGMAYFIT